MGFPDEVDRRKRTDCPEIGLSVTLEWQLAAGQGLLSRKLKHDISCGSRETVLVVCLVDS